MWHMKHVIIITMYLFALVIGNSPAAHAMGHAHGGGPVPMAAMAGDNNAFPHGPEDHTTANCCVVSVGHCSSETVRPEGAVRILHCSVEKRGRPLDNVAKAKYFPGIDPRPPRA